MAIDICVRIGRRIRVLRTKRRWTQDMLAGHAGITREHLSELESGKKEIGARTLERIATALDMNLSQFFDEV
jgi:transcriptional regulator with XRE-family HTH domain